MRGKETVNETAKQWNNQFCTACEGQSFQRTKTPPYWRPCPVCAVPNPESGPQA